MLLLITDSHDATSDTIIHTWNKLGFQDFLRFNTDFYTSYDIELNPSGFSITDPKKRTVSNSNITSMYWRKPWMEIAPPPQSLEEFEQTQRKYLVREIINLCRNDGVYFLVEPYAEHRVGKVIQMTKAEQFFPVPEWKIAIGASVSSLNPPWVVKALYSQCVDKKAPTVTLWTGDKLSPNYQWFLQKEVNGDFDVTVVFVNGSLFAYRLKRVRMDWRAKIDESMNWEFFEPAKEFTDAVRNYMDTLNLKYGRLDFIHGKDGKMYFLEVNPNGQFAWLDLHDKDGLISFVARNAIGDTSP